MRFEIRRLFTIDPTLVEAHVPEGVVEGQSFPVKIPTSNTNNSDTSNLEDGIVELQVTLPSGYQVGDVVFVDRSGKICSAWSNEVRGWLWYCFARAPVYPFLLSYAAVFFLQLAKSNAGADGKVAFAGVRVNPNNTFTLSLVVCYVLMAIISPVLGAVCDFSAYRKQMFGVFAFLGCASLVLLVPAMYAQSLGASLFLGIASMFCYEASLNFVYAYLPEISRAQSIQDISAFGIAATNVAQISSLAAILPLMLWGGDIEDNGTRDKKVLTAMSAASIFVGVWWGSITIYSYRVLHSRPARRKLPEGKTLLLVGWSELFQVHKKVREHPDLFKFLLAYMFFVLALSTLTSSTVVIFNGDFGWQTTWIAAIFVIAQLLATCGALFSVSLRRWFGMRRTIMASLLLFAVLCPSIAVMYTSRENCTMGPFEFCKETSKCMARYHVDSFAKGASECTSQGSRYYLASPQNETENTCVQHACGNSNNCLIGLTLKPGENQTVWRFEDGTEPSIWQTADSQALPTWQSNQCVALIGQSGFWNLTDCTTPQYAVCEKPAELQGTLATNVIVALLFCLMAVLNGVILSVCRAYFATMVPADLEAEMFGLYSMANKLIVWVGLLIFAVANEATGNYQWGLFGMIPFFVGGIFILWFVDDALITENLKKHMISRRHSLATPKNRTQNRTQNRANQLPPSGPKKILSQSFIYGKPPSHLLSEPGPPQV